MNRYDAPQSALSRSSRATDRRDIGFEVGSTPPNAQSQLLVRSIRAAYAESVTGSSPRSRIAARIAGSASAVGTALGRLA